MAAIRAAHASPLAAIYAVADCWTGMAGSPEELANHLSFLVMDLTDPEFHHYALVQARASHDSMRGLRDDAVKAGEFNACDTERLARVVQETIQGSLVAWAIFREGAAGDWVRRDLEFLLEPYLARKRGKRRQVKPEDAGSGRPSRGRPARAGGGGKRC